MRLKGRLELIARKVPKCDIVCDVGTDHAYIPIYLMEDKRCRRAVASDVKLGPLHAAEENIRNNGFENCIVTRLGYGIDTISENESDVIVIAGMGGILITNILEKGINKARKANLLVLQPMNSIEFVREWLYSEGFDIIDEELAAEGEKIYVVISARWDGIRRQYSQVYYHIGRKLVEKRDPLLEKYINRKIIQLESVLDEMKKMDRRDMEIEQKYGDMKNEFENIANLFKQGGCHEH